VGLAELATDGRPGHRFPSSDAAHRRFGTLEVPLDDVRTVARQHGVRVSDVLLAAVAGGLRRVQPAADRGAARLRVAVPLMVRAPSARARVGAGSASAEGNATAAVMMDLPLGPMSELERLADVAAHSRRLRTGSRALASRFVMRRIGALLPPPAHAWFARTVYGARFFHAIVSNIPGPDDRLSLAGAPLLVAYPILPLAPGTALAVGALGWHGSLCVGVSTDPALVDDADRLASTIAAVIGELRRSVPAGSVAGTGDGPAMDRSRGAGR
jgi:hypothetical protein